MTLLVCFNFSAPKKRSIVVAGHKTSFTLEDNFWHLLKYYAQCHNTSVSSIVAELDKMRGIDNHIGLSCIIRQFISNDVLVNHIKYQDFIKSIK